MGGGEGGLPSVVKQTEAGEKGCNGEKFRRLFWSVQLTTGGRGGGGSLQSIV